MMMNSLKALACRTVAALGLAISLVAAFSPAHALTDEEARKLATGDTDDRAAALAKAVESADEKTFALIKAMMDDGVKIAGGHVLIVQGDTVIDAVSGAAASLPDDAEDVVNNNRMRGELEAAMAALKLFAKEASLRKEAAAAMLKEPDPARLAMIDKALAAETDSGVKTLLQFAQAAARLSNADAGLRLDAAKAIAASATPDTVLLLNQRIAEETDPAVKAAMAASLREVESGLQVGEKLGTLFTGVSLGSILLLVALGLAITYGLMGVINMAHGELMMIGAYATYLVQVLFQKYLPGAFDW